VLLAACERPPHTSGPLPQDVYVWQRIWTKEVDSVLPEAQSHFHELLPLAAEVSWKYNQPVVTQIAIDYPSLREVTQTIGLVLRINAYNGPFRSQDNATHELEDLGRTLITNAQHAGFTVTELQLDFDCAAAKLAEYRVWVHALKEALSPTPVHITVLPSWIKKPGFGRLIAEAGEFILQVHSVDPPMFGGDRFEICDTNRAKVWVENAAAFSIPFRVALPTYSCLVAFDSTTKLVGLSAEGPSIVWPQNTHLKVYNSDPERLSKLVQRWIQDRPEKMEGIVWYRLPVPIDRRNWRLTTLLKVAAGLDLRHSLRVQIKPSQPLEVSLKNEGDVDERLPEKIVVRWGGGSLRAADGLGFYRLGEQTASSLELLKNEGPIESNLSPETTLSIAWLSVDSPDEVHAEIVHPASDHAKASNSAKASLDTSAARDR
jgi:hypothetical protein